MRVAALLLHAGLVTTAAAIAAPREREFFRNYEDGLAALSAGDCARAVELLQAAAAQEPVEARRKRTYGMNVIEYYPHASLARALHCLGKDDAAGREVELAA